MYLLVKPYLKSFYAHQQCFIYNDIYKLEYPFKFSIKK